MALPDVTLPGTPATAGSLGLDTSTGTAYVALDPWMMVQDDAGQTVRLDGVAVVDVASGTVKTTIPLPGLIPTSLAVDSTAHMVYVSALSNGSGTASITVIDGTTNMVTGKPIGAPGLGDVYLVVDPSAKKVFGYDGTSHVDVFDVAGMSFVTRITLSGYDTSLFGNTQGGLALDPASHSLWVLGPAGDDGGIPTSSMLTAIDGTANTAGAQTPYSGAPAYLADDLASTSNVFVVTQNPQTVVLDGPIDYQVPPQYTVTVIQDICGTRASGFGVDATGKAWALEFDATGKFTGAFDTIFSDVVLAMDVYDGGTVELVEQVVNGSPTVLPVLKRNIWSCPDGG